MQLSTQESGVAERSQRWGGGGGLKGHKGGGGGAERSQRWGGLDLEDP